MEEADDIRDDDAINTEEKIWDLTQSINVKGVWFGCKHAVIAMRKVCWNTITLLSAWPPTPIFTSILPDGWRDLNSSHNLHLSFRIFSLSAVHNELRVL